MSTPVAPIPEGFRSVTPHIVVKDARAALDFYKAAFGAEELCFVPGPGGEGCTHAEFKIGDSMLMLAQEMEGMEHWLSPETHGGTTVALHIYTEDTDAAFQRAVDAGGAPGMPPMDMFWGDRYARVTDPFGHEWSLATHMKDLTPEQIQAGQEAFFASFQDGSPCSE